MTEIRGVSLQERKKILGRDVKQYTVIKKKPLYFLHTNIRLLNSDAVLQKNHSIEYSWFCFRLHPIT